MNSKDRDIKKLKGYIKNLGITLKFLKKTKYTGSAEYDYNKKSINVFINTKTTKTDIIMSLLHELGHYLDERVNKTDVATTLALISLSNGPMEGVRLDIPKKSRKIILQTERNGIKYMTRIHKFLELEIPYNLVVLQQVLDIFDYEYLYKYGRFPTANKYKKEKHERSKRK